MNLLPADPHARRDLCIGALVAALILVTAAVLDLPWLATTVFPGLWVVLRARSPRCAAAPTDIATPR